MNPIETKTDNEIVNYQKRGKGLEKKPSSHPCKFFPHQKFLSTTGIFISIKYFPLNFFFILREISNNFIFRNVFSLLTFNL